MLDKIFLIIRYLIGGCIMYISVCCIYTGIFNPGLNIIFIIGDSIIFLFGILFIFKWWDN